MDLLSQRETVREELKKMELRRETVALAAPADAVVLDLGQRSVGSIVREAEPMVTLIPLDVPLKAEVAINTRGIGRVGLRRVEEAQVRCDRLDRMLDEAVPGWSLAPLVKAFQSYAASVW